MSAGVFEKSGYQSDTLTRIYPIRIQAETVELEIDAVTNSAPVTPPNEEVSARARGSRRGYGVNARTVTLQFTAAPPTGYKPAGLVTVPILTPAVYSGIIKGQVGVYAGAPVIVVGKKPEYIN